MGSLATAIADALSADRIVASPYTFSYNATMGRFQITNLWSGTREDEYIIARSSSVTNRSRGVRGCFRQIGMVDGTPAYVVNYIPVTNITTLNQLPNSTKPNTHLHP